MRGASLQGMAKDRERAMAKELFMKGKSNKSIAKLVNVGEKTITSWDQKYGWKKQREAKLSSHKTQIENVRELLGTLITERLTIQDDIEVAKQNGDTEKESELRKKVNGIANEVAHYNKTLAALDKENKVPLTVYIQVMEEIFKDLQRKHPKIYTQTLDFQDEHINRISLKY